MLQQFSSLFLPTTRKPHGCWTKPWPCLKTSGLPLAQPLGPCSLLTLLFFKVDL